MVITADNKGRAFGWDAVAGKMEHQYDIPEGHVRLLLSK